MTLQAMKKEHSHILEVSNLVVSDHQTGTPNRILKGLDFSVRKGEILGLIGASGSGKSLTAKAILGLLPPGLKVDRGDIHYFPDQDEQFDLRGNSSAHLTQFRRNHIAMIFQNPALSFNPTLKIEEQLKVIVRLVGKGTPTDPLDDLLLKMGLQDPKRILNAYPHQLSGGQLQRVIIGMTILKKPTLWIADEPTTALDPEIRVQILELMKNVHGEIGGSMLYISHDMGSMRKMADRVIVIDRGIITESGAVQEVLEHQNNVFFDSADRKAVVAKKIARENDFLGDYGKNEPLVEIKELSKTFIQVSPFGFGKKRKVKAIDRISFSMFPGDALGIIGSSGSGKSTLAKLLIGLERADNGTIKFQNQELTKFNFKKWKEIRRKIQVVHQNPTQSLSPHLSAQVHLEEALQIKWGANETKIAEQFEQLIHDVGLSNELKDRFPFQLSGGECQRVCIARALALQPKVLICDEITSALDRKTQQQMISLLLSIRRKYDFSLICITHDLSVISQMTDKMILLDNGKIVESGNTNAFLTSPKSDQGKKILQAFATLA
jgi:peptide/nickel transport system ATP-binding protein